MIIYNKKETAYFQLGAEYLNSSYAIHSYNDTGCEEAIPVVTGIITNMVNVSEGDSYSFFEEKLLDGRYIIKTASDDIAPTETQSFVVFYNYLPDFLEDIRDIFCCDDQCKDTDLEKRYLRLFVNTIIFFVSTGLIYELPVMFTKLKKMYRRFKEKCHEETYTNKFSFQYKLEIFDFFTYLYAELYLYQTNKIKSVNHDIKEVESMFLVNTVERCLYNSKLDTKDIIENVINLNRNCNE